jgi:hypothetical protein
MHLFLLRDSSGRGEAEARSLDHPHLPFLFVPQISVSSSVFAPQTH